MQTDFNSNYLLDRMTDESLIDNSLPDDVVDLFYAHGVADEFRELAIDFGGGILGITCRSVLSVTNSDANKLLDILQLRKSKENRALCSSIIATCRQQVKSSAFLL